MTLPGKIGRKLIHLSSLAIPIGYLFLPRDSVLRVIIPIAAGSLILDLARLRNRLLGKTFLRVSKSLLKKDERARLTGSTYLLLASVVCVFFFPRPIAIAALLFLALGVSASVKNGEGGYLCEPSVETFADKVCELLTNDSLRKHKAAQAKLRAEQLSSVKMAKRFVDCYSEAQDLFKSEADRISDEDYEKD
jgi:hypothetical protein